MENPTRSFGSPFLGEDAVRTDVETNDWSPQLAQLLFESPYARLSNEAWAPRDASHDETVTSDDERWYEGDDELDEFKEEEDALPTSGRFAEELVRFAQRVLNATQGEHLTDDGDLGRLTAAAVQRFREKYRLGAGFTLDQSTTLALAQCALEALAKASLFAHVGRNDAATDAAIGSFRAEHGLGFGTLVDAATRRALTTALASLKQPTTSDATATTLSKVTATPVEHLGGKLWTFDSQAAATAVAVFLPKAAVGKQEVDVLLYAHGLLGGCTRPHSVPDGIISGQPFELGRIVDASLRPVVLVVPLLDWSRPGGAAAFGKERPRWNENAKPQRLNTLISEVLAEVARVQGSDSHTLRQLIVSGHSRAYDFLEPLAFLRDDPEMERGALAKLTQVWAFDTTYGGDPARWKRWLQSKPGLQAHFFYRPETKTATVGDRFYANRSDRLHVTKCTEGHCAVPRKRMLPLLKQLPSPADLEVLQELEDMQDESFADDLLQMEDELDFELAFEEDGTDEEAEPDFEEDGTDEETALELDSEEADQEEEFEFEEEEAAENGIEDEVADTSPLQVPPDDPVPFAAEPAAGSYWPVRTSRKDARVVSYRYRDASGFAGREGRMFLAGRRGKRKGKIVARRHVGVDLFAHIGDEVVACESGTIVAFGFFYKAKSGQETFRLMVEHAGVVINYGEVTGDSLTKNGLKVGSAVAAGQRIGFVSDTSMIHFETYVRGSTTTKQWWKSDEHAPASLLNPTRYLIFLRDHGVGPTGAVTASTPQTSAPTSGSKPDADTIRFAQRVLNAAEGGKLDDDGKRGRHTRAAIAQFRQKYNLGAQDDLDNTTLLALAQRALEELAQQSIFAQIGKLDEATRQALADFRAGRGLGTDPRLDSATRKALTDALAKRQKTPSPPASNPPTTSVGVTNYRAGLTPPTNPSAYRKFRLTTYHVVDQNDEPTGAIRIPIFDENKTKLADCSPSFFAKLSLEGTGRLTDGRLVNVTGKTVSVAPADYADVLAHHNKAYQRRNEKRRQQGRSPIATQYSGITVANDQVTRAFAFAVVDASKRGLGYGTGRGVAYTPFRTLAADIGVMKYKNAEPKWKGKGGLVPPGTRVYIKEYEGLRLPDNTTHDGWFVVNDTGGGIYGAHFDVFTGTEALRKQVKVPAFGQVWFPGIEDRIPADYTYGLAT